MTEDLFKQMAQSIINGEPEDAEALAKLAVEQGIDQERADKAGPPCHQNLH